LKLVHQKGLIFSSPFKDNDSSFQKSLQVSYIAILYCL